MTPDDLRDMLLEVADAVRSEPDTLRRAALIGEFRHETTRLRQELLAETSYEGRTARVNNHLLASAMHVDRRTVNLAAFEHARSHGLDVPPTLRNTEKIVTDIKVPRRGG